MSERSTCRSLGTRFLAVYWLKKSFLSKVKGMNDWGIRGTFPLCAQIFEFLVQTPILKKNVRAIYMYIARTCGSLGRINIPLTTQSEIHL